MYCVTVTFRIDPPVLEHFVSLVRTQARNSLLLEEGCQRFDVWATQDRPAEVYLYEIYDDRAAFDAHLDSGHFRQFERDTAALVRDKSVAVWDQLL